MSLRSRIQVAVFAIAAMVAASCGSTEPDVAPTADLSAIPGSELDEFVTEFQVALSEVNDAQVAGEAITGTGPRSAVAEAVPVEIDAVRATAAGLGRVILPGHPDDDDVRRLYFQFMEGLGAWVDGLETGADALEAELDTFTAQWADGPPDRYLEIAAEMDEAKQTYQQACSAIAEALVARTSTSIACVAEAASTSAD